jgi:Fic family protein
MPGVDEAVTVARTSVDALLRHRILRRRSAEVTAEVSLRAARASAALEGHDVPLEALRARLTADPAPTGTGTAIRFPPDATQVTLGAVRLYAELGALGSAWERAPRQALARMHVLLGRGLVPDVRLGRPRGSGSAVDDPLGLGSPPPPEEVAARLDGLVGLLVARTAAPAIVVAAVVHGELLALRPFGYLDGIVARAAARLVLISRGLDPKALTATDVGQVEAGTADGGGTPVGVGRSDATGAAAEVPPGAAYRAAAAGYVHGGADGVRDWVVHCARGVELGARESLAVCEALARA